MTMHDKNLSRRTMLKGASALVIGLYLPRRGARAVRRGAGVHARRRRARTFAPNAFVRVGADDTVTVLCKHIEFGQGPFTGLATLVAEEMDADWSQMRAEHAPADPQALQEPRLRRCRAPAARPPSPIPTSRCARPARPRAPCWCRRRPKPGRCPPSEITVEKGVLSHAASQPRRAASASSRRPRRNCRCRDNAPLKDPADFKLIGREGAVNKLDSADKINGTAQFTIDIREPDMLTVVVAHPPRFGGKVASFDDTEARKVPGVVDVKQIPLGRRGLCARHVAGAQGPRGAAASPGTRSNAEKRGSDQLIEEYRALAPQARHGRRHAWRCRSGARKRASKVIEAEYVFPYLAHAPMEPLDGYLRWDGERALARFGSQFQTGDHAAIAKVLGLTPEQGGDRDHARRRQLRPPRAAGFAFRRRARGGRQGDRPQPAGQARLDARGRPAAAATTGRSSCIACAARCDNGKIVAWSNTDRRPVVPEGLAVRGA